MALKFLNKKGWHTGSLRNIETVWKAEQKHESEQKKLEELRKQIHDEREKSEFRTMQEQAGLVPKQERLEFLYDSGLQVGKVAQADEYLLGKPLEEAVQPESEVGQVAAKPGALFVEEKPASANDSWRKLHSDPLFLIKQQEQAAITRITSNPVKMAEIKKAAEAKKRLKEEKKKKRKEAKRERKEKRKRKKHHESSSEDSSESEDAGKSRKRRQESGERAQVKYRSPSRSPTRSPTRSPVVKDRRQSPRGGERKRVLSLSPSRSPVARDHDRGRSRKDDYPVRGAHNKLEGRQRDQRRSDFEQRKRAPSRSPSRSLSRSPTRVDRRGSDLRPTSDFEHRKSAPTRSPPRNASRSPVRRDRRGSDSRRTSDFEQRKRALSRSPSRSPVRGDRKSSDFKSKDFEGRDPIQRKRAPSRSASRSPVRRERKGMDSRAEEFEGRDFARRKRAPTRSPSRSASRSPVRRELKGIDFRSRETVQRMRAPSRSASRSPIRRERKGSDFISKEFEGRERKRAPTRSPSRSASRSPPRRESNFRLKSSVQRKRTPSRSASRSPVRRDHDQRSRGSDGRDHDRRKRASSRSRSRSPVRRSPVRRPRRDDFKEAPEDRDYGKQMRVKRPSRSPSRSPPPRRGDGQNGARRDVVDSRPRDSRPLEQESNGEKLDADGRKDTNGPSSRPGMNKGKPPKPVQLSDAERAARLAEMQANADAHEEQRWQRLKRAADADVVEAKRAENDKSNDQFIADTRRSMFTAGDKSSGASTIEKSVKRRAHFVERSSGDNERNAFRR